MLHKYAKLLILSVALFCVAGKALAATQIYLAVPSVPIAPSSTFSVKILVDADRLANAYSATLHFGGPVELLRTNNANSIIVLWQKNPTVADGAMHFEGGSLEPFAGIGGQLLSLDFKATATGTAVFSFSDASIYLADGQGTKIMPDEKKAVVSIAENLVEPATSSAPSETTLTGATDVVVPEIQFLAIVNDPSSGGSTWLTASNQKLLSFLVSDASSGVKDSFVRYRTAAFWSDWRLAANPAPLPGNAWEISLRVEDNAGNVVERTLYDWPAFGILAAEATVVVLAFGTAGWWVAKRRKMSD
jgi:hypothetical protein